MNGTMSTAADLMRQLHVDHYPARWDTIFAKAMADYQREGACFASVHFLEQLNQSYGVMQGYEQAVLEAAKQIREDTLLTGYIQLLQFAMRDRKAFLQEISEISPPQTPEGQPSEAYDFILFFALAPMIEGVAQAMRQRGVPDDICLDTLKALPESINQTHFLTGRPGLSFRYFNWFQLYLDHRILKVGRLNFEFFRAFNGSVKLFRNKKQKPCLLMADCRLQDGMVFGSPGYQDEEQALDADFRETESYFEGYPVRSDGLADSSRICLPKTEWHLVLEAGDPIVSVHIPNARVSSPFTPEICDQSYQQARAVLASCYPDYPYKAIICNSWLMDPQLKQMLSPKSNIVSFQNRYLPYPRLATGQGVFSFVFVRPFKKLEDLPEQTSLERAIKRHYLAGQYIYEQGGIFKAT